MSGKVFSKRNALLTLIGLGVNMLFVKLASALGLPVYLDTIGTVLVAAYGGMLPGITVGFLSNIVTSLSSISTDPLTLYYGILNIAIAMVTAAFSVRGRLRNAHWAPLYTLLLALIGGELGAVMTWILYGFDFGSGVTAPLAVTLFESGMPKEIAELAASLLVDLLDKVITTFILLFSLRLIPFRFICHFPLGYVYDRSKPFRYIPKRRSRLYRKRSIRTRLVMIIVIVALVFSISSITSSVIAFRRMLIEQYSEKCQDAASVMATQIPGNRVEVYLSDRGQSIEYRDVKARLETIFRGAHQITYMYVYQVQPDGCHVVFDLDTETLAGEAPGTIIPFDESFAYYIPKLLNGERIDPIITDDTYGWLLTAYEPIYNSAGECVAYACADIDMRDITNIVQSFFISIAALLFGAFVLLSCFALYYCDSIILEPISMLVEHARHIDYSENGRQLACENEEPVQTGDELETLYQAMCERDKRIGGYIAEISHKNRELSQMQRNIIFSLANMTESRDENTGNHIKRTAAYVRIIAQQLRLDGYQKQEITGEYILHLYESAPLHDIGKIKISDTILNKPGKLTAEEFDIMKTHTTIGKQILQSSLEGISDGGSLLMAIDMVESHHEKWDGTGYPNGLKGEAIPLCARIMAVSDVFDALVSKRSYKSAMPIEEAVDIIRGDAGRHFDPEVVTAFVRALSEIREAAKL